MTTWFDHTTVPAGAAPKKRRTLLPVLTVLFLLSYALMTMLIVEQGAAIQSQSNLIKVLLPDSRELWVLKGKAIGDKQMAKAPKQGQSNNPSAPAPSNRPQATQPPPTQAVPPSHLQGPSAKAGKPDRQFPPVPASELLDQRRASHTI